MAERWIRIEKFAMLMLVFLSMVVRPVLAIVFIVGSILLDRYIIFDDQPVSFLTIGISISCVFFTSGCIFSLCGSMNRLCWRNSGFAS